MPSSCGQISQEKGDAVKLPSAFLGIGCQSDVKFVVSENKGKVGERISDACFIPIIAPAATQPRQRLRMRLYCLVSGLIPVVLFTQDSF